MLVSLGMTLVIATRGIDISVGAVVAIAAALAAWMIGGSLVVNNGARRGEPLPDVAGDRRGAGVALVCGLWNGLLVARVGMQPIIATLILMVAGRGIAQLITGGQIITIYYAPFFFIGSGYLFGLPFSRLHRGGGVRAAVPGDHAHARWACSSRRWASTRRRRAWRACGRGGIIVGAYVFCGFCAGVAGLLISSNVKSADGNNAGQLLELDAILAVTLGGTALTGGRFSLVGSVIGALIIQTLTYAIYSLGVPPEINLVVKAVVVFVVMLLQSAEFRASRAPAGAAAGARGGGAMSAVVPESQRRARRSAARRRAGRATRLNPKYLPLAATISLFVLMATLGSVFYDGFFSPQVFLNLLIDNAFLCIVAVGMTFVILSGGIDLSVGSVIALTTMVSASLVEKHGWSPAVVIPLVLVMGTVFGAFMGLLIERFRLQPFIVTLAGMFLARGLCYLISIDSISITNEFYSEVSQMAHAGVGRRLDLDQRG